MHASIKHRNNIQCNSSIKTIYIYRIQFIHFSLLHFNSLWSSVSLACTYLHILPPSTFFSLSLLATQMIRIIYGKLSLPTTVMVGITSSEIPPSWRHGILQELPTFMAWGREEIGVSLKPELKNKTKLSEMHTMSNAHTKFYKAKLLCNSKNMFKCSKLKCPLLHNYLLHAKPFLY